MAQSIVNQQKNAEWDILPQAICPYLQDKVGEGNGNPPQYSCLENPVDRGAWWAAVHRVAQSWTRLKQRSSSSSQKKVVEMTYNPCFGVTLSQNRKRALGYIFRGFWVL